MQNPRQQLEHLIDDGAVGRLGDRPAILLLALPFLLVLGLELVGRARDDAAFALRFPWQTEQHPYPRSSTEHPPRRGDLARMARLPAYDALFPERERAPIRSDESGFKNAPANLADPFRERPRDITLVGASFMVTGSFAESLAEHSGREVYNAAWPGRGALFPLLHLLDSESVGAAGERVLVYGIVQRSLGPSAGFHHLTARLDADGGYHRPGAKSVLRNQARTWLGWPGRLDDQLLKTSPAVDAAGQLARYLPPMALDRGLTSSVKLARLREPDGRPVLILGETLRSTPRRFEERGGPSIVEALRRLSLYCRARDVRLVMVLVPDKLQVLAPHLEPLNFRGIPPLPAAEAATTRFAAALEQAGVEAVDLLPVLSGALRPGGELVYLLDDTHWSERGSRLAGERVAERLRD